jgi:hypothetical protein
VRKNRKRRYLGRLRREIRFQPIGLGEKEVFYFLKTLFAFQIILIQIQISTRNDYYDEK